MKCANCKLDALYFYKLTASKKIPYCKGHLPKFLEPLRKAGNLETTDALKKLSENNVKALSLRNSIKPVVVAEPVSEEAVTEEVVAEEVVEAVVETPAEPVIEAVVEENTEPPKPKRKKAAPKVAEDASNS
jgi:hypothetical protein